MSICHFFGKALMLIVPLLATGINSGARSFLRKQAHVKSTWWVRGHVEGQRWRA